MRKLLAAACIFAATAQAEVIEVPADFKDGTPITTHTFMQRDPAIIDKFLRVHGYLCVYEFDGGVPMCFGKQALELKDGKYQFKDDAPVFNFPETKMTPGLKAMYTSKVWS
tara:strand:- start:114110 stop:114442 length:333 start_codon:yes stop_codon:yes gene_type:complete